MTPAQAFNEEQRERWNGIDGEHWAREQDYLERLLAPVNGPLLAFAEPRTASTVLDVGCGCGATTIELARAVGPSGRVVGIDISAPMLARAKERLRDFPNTVCLLGDAAELPLRDFGAELMVSRLGVMFFGDPVAAFANLGSGLASGGRVRFACWRPIQENPWLQVPLHAIYEHTPRLPKPGPEEPGPFSFADVARVERVLMSAGFTRPSFTPLDLQLDLAAGGAIEDAALRASGTGPARRALNDQPDDVRAAAAESIRRALKPYEAAGVVKLPAALWLVSIFQSKDEHENRTGNEEAAQRPTSFLWFLVFRERTVVMVASGRGKVGNLLLVFHFSMDAKPGGGNVGISRFLRDFQGTVESVGNPLLVFHAFHGPGISTALR